MPSVRSRESGFFLDSLEGFITLSLSERLLKSLVARDNEVCGLHHNRGASIFYEGSGKKSVNP